MDEMFTFPHGRRAVRGIEPIRMGTLWMKCLPFHMVGELSKGLNPSEDIMDEMVTFPHGRRAIEGLEPTRRHYG